MSKRTEWTCDGCGKSIDATDGDEPSNWAFRMTDPDGNEGHICLDCLGILAKRALDSMTQENWRDYQTDAREEILAARRRVELANR